MIPRQPPKKQASPKKKTTRKKRGPKIGATVRVVVPLLRSGDVAVDAEVAARGLVIHRSFERGATPEIPRGWSVTHAKTGRAVLLDVPSPPLARLAAAELARGLDWSLDRAAITSDFRYEQRRNAVSFALREGIIRLPSRSVPSGKAGKRTRG